MFQLVTPCHAYQVHAACGRRIGMRGYMSVPEDRRTFINFWTLTKFFIVLKATRFKSYTRIELGECQPNETIHDKLP